MNYPTNYENLLNFVTVMTKILAVPFFRDTVVLLRLSHLMILL